eukprot:Skav224244  [mRNA]  locus=scaffold939:1464009:1465647:- [translate_table: standard]
MGNETGGNVSNQTESPWPEALAGKACGNGGHGDERFPFRALQDYFPEIFATDFKTKNGLPFIRYNGCTMAETCEAFCNYASNPGCGGSARNGVVTFRNIRYAHGCRVKPVLSIPRSYIRDLEPGPKSGCCGVKSQGTYSMLKSMLHSGFDTYRAHGHHGPAACSVQQCIHQSWAVSVRWVHLHSFCTGARFDGMPGGSSLCATMRSHDDAASIAQRWAR